MKKETSKKLGEILLNVFKCAIFEELGSAEHLTEYVSSDELIPIVKELAAENEEVLNAIKEELAESDPEYGIGKDISKLLP